MDCQSREQLASSSAPRSKTYSTSPKSSTDSTAPTSASHPNCCSKPSLEMRSDNNVGPLDVRTKCREERRGAHVQTRADQNPPRNQAMPLVMLDNAFLESEFRMDGILQVL